MMSGNRTRPEGDGIHRYLKPLLWGIACAAGACCLLLLFLAGIMSLRDVPLGLVDPLMVVAAALAAFAGGYVCARKTREKGMLMGMLCAGALFLLLFLCSLPITGLSFSTILPVKLLSMLLLGAVGGILGVNRKVRHK